jgi:hypothetical protein
VNAAVPALLGGFLGSASSGNGAANILSTLNNVDDSLVGNLGNFLSGGQQSAGLMDMSERLLGSLLGGGNVGGLTTAISTYSGLGKGAAGSLLGLIAPLLMGSGGLRR